MPEPKDDADQSEIVEVTIDPRAFTTIEKSVDQSGSETR